VALTNKELAMAAEKRSIETEFLHEFAITYIDEISFTRQALEDLERLGVGLADVKYVLRYGNVTETLKEESDGAIWMAEGATSDGKELRVRAHVWCNEYRVRIIRILEL
jgi:hypothetical protein